MVGGEMQPGRCDLVIWQGQAVDETVVWYDKNGDLVDVTGYSAKCEVRENRADSLPKLTITVSVGTTDGQFDLDATAVLTRALNFDRGFWSLEISPGGAADLNVSTDNIVLVSGIVTVKREITK